MNRINIITLGVRDVLKAGKFYKDGLGFITPSTEANPSILFFNNGGTKLALYPIESLAEDIDKANPPKISSGFSGITLAYNTKTQNEVDRVFSKIEQIGGKIVKAPAPTFWGGYGGYFQDLDGYYWEVAYADSWIFDNNDMLVITE